MVIHGSLEFTDEKRKNTINFLDAAVSEFNNTYIYIPYESDQHVKKINARRPPTGLETDIDDEAYSHREKSVNFRYFYLLFF